MGGDTRANLVWERLRDLVQPNSTGTSNSYPRRVEAPSWAPATHQQSGTYQFGGSRHTPFGPPVEQLNRMNYRQLHPIAKDVGGGRKMTEREFERVFQIPGNGQGVNGAEAPIPATCDEDTQKGMTTAQVISQIQNADENRVQEAQAHGFGPRVPELINWRLPIGDHDHGETITIAQQLVYIGNVSFLTRR